jgi:hypothetical protein
MVPASPEGSKGSYPSQHDEADGVSTTKDASLETEGWSYLQIYFMNKK